MTTITYSEIQFENLIKIDYSQIITNFRTIDAFMKNMSTFQRSINLLIQKSPISKKCKRQSHLTSITLKCQRPTVSAP